jgi:hypothetical protein
MVLYIVVINTDINNPIYKLFKTYLIIHSFCLKYSINFIHNDIFGEYNKIFNVSLNILLTNHIKININLHLNNLLNNLIELNNDNNNNLIECDINLNDFFYFVFKNYLNYSDIKNTLKLYNIIPKNENYICIDFYNNIFGAKFISNEYFLKYYNELELDLPLYINIYNDTNLDFINKNFKNHIKIYNNIDKFNKLFNAKYKIISYSYISKLINKINDI